MNLESSDYKLDALLLSHIQLLSAKGDLEVSKWFAEDPYSPNLRNRD